MAKFVSADIEYWPCQGQTSKVAASCLRAPCEQSLFYRFFEETEKQSICTTRKRSACRVALEEEKLKPTDLAMNFEENTKRRC